MIIELHNFGPIERFTFDTEKQMYFIFGENNVGKSYAISAVYLILKNWKKAMESISSLEVTDWSYYNLKIKLNTYDAEIDVKDFFADVSINFIKSYFIKNLENSFSNTFSSVNQLFNKYSRKTFSFQIKDKEFTLSFTQIGSEFNSISLNELTYNKSILIYQDSDIINRYYYKSKNSHNLTEYDFFTLNERNTVLRLFQEIYNDIFIKSTHNDFYFLPASRSGLYNGLSAFNAIIVQLTQLRSQIPNNKFEIPTLSEPNSDYFLNISSINGKGYSTPFSKFAKKIEDKIIKGKISFDKSDRKLYYEPEKLDLSLELSQASSMISEIAPIIAHLKFILNNAEGTENYLFIEEPEAHLHPKIQVELMKLFAELAGNGLHIVMTSHSNYLFNKLSNMVLAKEIDPKTISVCLMKMGENGSFVDENAMHIDEDGIDDDNFADTAEELYSERLKLYEQNL